MTARACGCAELARRPFDCVEAAVYGREADELRARCELVERDEPRWMSLLRCRVCGAHWVEACSSSGPMDSFHLAPAPAGGDPVRWFRELAGPLPFRRRS